MYIQERLPCFAGLCYDLKTPSKARNPCARMRMLVRIRKISNSKVTKGEYPYIRMNDAFPHDNQVH